MNVSLVTGASGFLGSHLCERLLRDGQTVIGVDNFSTGLRSNADFLKKLSPNFKFVEADVVRPWTWLPAALPAGASLKWVFHFASPASPPHYQRLALETLRVNSVGLENALGAADAHGGRVIFASTSEVYGDPDVSPQPESYWGNVNSFGERSCYDEAKRFGESLLYSWNRQNKTKHGLVRIFNTYGPRMNPDDGRVVINFIVQALEKRPLTMYGDGSQTRSFCYVDDLIEGILKYAAASLTDPVNLGNDREFSILELARIVQKVVGPGDTQHLPLPSDDPRQRKPDLSRARKLLAPWEPKVSLEDGIVKMRDWVETSLKV